MSSDLTLGKTLLKNDFVQIVALVPVNSPPPEIKEEKTVPSDPVVIDKQLCYQLRPNYYQCGPISDSGSFYPDGFGIISPPGKKRLS